MPKIESEKIDCLYRPCSRPAPRGKIESVRTHSEVLEQFDSFSLFKLLFLVRNWHYSSRKAFPRQMTPKAEKKLRKGRFFNTADRHEKLYGRSRLYGSAQGRHETGGVLSLFSSLSFDISIKNSMQRWSSDFQGLFRVKIRKMAQGSNDLSTLPLSPKTIGSCPPAKSEKVLRSWPPLHLSPDKLARRNVLEDRPQRKNSVVGHRTGVHNLSKRALFTECWMLYELPW